MGQQLNTIPIQYYFIGWKGGIQDRSGLDSEMAEMAVFLDWDLIICPIILPSSTRHPDPSMKDYVECRFRSAMGEGSVPLLFRAIYLEQLKFCAIIYFAVAAFLERTLLMPSQQLPLATDASLMPALLR
jgi:hypothetical protein